MSEFEELGLSARALEAVKRLGYAEPTPVQQRAIPVVLEGRDVIAAAKTGTGKTAAFSLPTMDRLGRAPRKTGPLMLVVTPTRELAQQIGDVCAEIALSTHHRILTVVGGLSYNPQINKLKNGVDVLIATPGRLIDLMERKAVDLSHVRVLVLDEADRMLDMGFLPSVKKIAAAVPSERQTLLFSATIDDAVQNAVGSLLHNPASVEVAQRGDTADTIEQSIVRVSQAAKPALLAAVLSSWGAERVIVFARTRGRADSCARRLARQGFKAAAIHSDKSQNQRRRALDSFAAGETKVIVATDVLSRGIDVNGVDYVVNFDMPTQPEDYVHRIGRTGRAGCPGRALSFVTPETEADLKAVEKLTHQKLEEVEIEGFNLAAAEVEATGKAQRAANRSDPEIAQATKELKAKKSRRAKAKAKGREAEERSGRTRGGNARPKDAQKQAARSEKPAAKKRTEKGKKRDRKQDDRKGKQRRRSQTPTSAGSAKPKRDLRPGRAHRAAVAEQRRRKKM